MTQGADRNRKTADGETALELVEEDDYKTKAVLLNTKEEVEKERRQSVVKDKQEKREPAWVRRESVQEAEAVRRKSLQEVEQDTRRKGSAWVGREEIPEEEEEEGDESEEEIIVAKVSKRRERRQGRLELPPLGEESFVIEKDKER